MPRYLCIHGHFYQPPRENPWLEEVELQDSAHPYHDWNERVCVECYGPNAASRILDDRDRIVDIVNNYARISFDIGPTLLSWLEDHAPAVYAALLEADRESAARFGGHGSALAQPYNHMIMPLARADDQRTQVLWGIRDFERRFRRRPEGMWLPETAVDLPTLELLAEQDVQFTILAPHQAARVRLGNGAWNDVTGGRVDPRRAYRLQLPSGRAIALFFYDGPISRAVAFERLLNRGENFAHRLLGGFSGGADGDNELVHATTDGETYGHHHRFGDMALAYAVRFIESQGLAHWTNYGQYLERHPPTWEVQIVEHTSWSCVHGLERWRADCGCNSGAHPGWSQAWRRPLRMALDDLRDEAARLYADRAGRLLRDPAAARNEYIDVILDRSPQSRAAFLERQAVAPLTDDERVEVLKLLEMQRHAMLMYTSCGWFFDDLGGIETVQILRYAGRVAQLARELFGDHVEERFVERLAEARSNQPVLGTGRAIYDRLVRPTALDPLRVAAHFVVSSLFDPVDQVRRITSYEIDVGEHRAWEEGGAQLVAGWGRISSRITTESRLVSFAALYLGDHTINAAVQDFPGEQTHKAAVDEALAAFSRADVPELIRILDRRFGSAAYSVRSLFRDAQRRILDRILARKLREVEAGYERVYRENLPLIRYLADLGLPQPRAFRLAAEHVLNASLRRALEAPTLEPSRVRHHLQEAREGNIALDARELARAVELALGRVAEAFRQRPTEPAVMAELEAGVEVALDMPFGVDLSQAQNAFFSVMKAMHASMGQRAAEGHEAALGWLRAFEALGEKLAVKVPAAPLPRPDPARV